MSPERWLRVGELFHEALELPSPGRTAWAVDACGGDTVLRRELLSLLENDRAAAGAVEGSIKSAVTNMFEAPARQRVGPYRLLRELGRGGMGTVYLAERDDEQYQTQVAIKLVRPGMDTEFILHRFRRERQILAQLDHPHIARLLDGGTTEDGIPYFVMEYIEGETITEYANSRQLGIEARLKLFLDVCSAVEYAHQRFVIHRDIKPGNILISSEGVAKLLDFGVCKVLRNEGPNDTATGTVCMMTPEYASPEQVRGDPVTIASDIYSLAAVLYELLTNYKPHRIEKLTPQALERAICDHDIIRPSLVPDKALARRLAGDLDNILMLALQKDPDRRYSSVEQFSADVRRYLANEPIKARPDTIRYRLRKLARRQRGTLVAAGLILASLIGGLAVSLQQASIARANLYQARRLADEFIFGVHDAVRDLPGATRARQVIVETGLRYLDGLSGASSRDWNLKREIAVAYQRIGDVQGNANGANLGNTAGALNSYGKSMALLDTVLAHEPTNRAAQLARVMVLQRIGTVYLSMQDSDRALARLIEAQQIGEAMLGNGGDVNTAVELARTYGTMGYALWISGRFSRSIEEHRKAISLLGRFSAAVASNPEFRQLLAVEYAAVGMDELRIGSLNEALAHFEDARRLLEESERADPSNVTYQRGLLSVYSHIGDALGNPKWRSLGDAAGARAAYAHMLAIAMRLYQSDPANLQAANDYAIALTRVAAVAEGETEARVPILRESLTLLETIHRRNPQSAMYQWDLAHGHLLLGEALAGHNPAEATQEYEQCAEIVEGLIAKAVDLGVPDLVTARQRLAVLAARAGREKEALRHARRALEASAPSGRLAETRSASVQRFLTPRGSGAMGFVYAILSSSMSAADRKQNKEEALRWLDTSMEAWQAVESDPAFGPVHMDEMQRVRAAAAELRRR